MSNSKLVSVIIPTYNVQDFIEQAVGSIINQTYKNIEIIIVDDCSSDKTFEKLKKLAKQDSRIKLLRNDVNLKICKTLNKALKESKGEYIVRMDGDDISDKDRIEKQIEYLEKNQEIALVGNSVKNIDRKNNIFSTTKYCSEFKKLKKLARYGTPVLHIWAARREVYEKLDGYREIPYVEDYDFLLRMITSGYKFSNLENYYGYSVRFRQGNTTTTNGIEQIKAFEYARKMYEERKKSKNKLDSFNEEKFLEFIKVCENDRKKYIKSQKKLEKVFKEKNKVKKIFFLLNSIILSKYQLKKIIRRMLFKIYGNKI
ncbi:glycosyltransferase family 2 protein [uncultured Cetobacterium sp.]|uniref:glycosyltransferase family 2 protein n=1 Tax=uncultured Cetobacterium sp. TaxID=527638 RepID=UPI00262837CB|nr:glycosyltransferase family 2 protein [uncultured Cetobacterium sp.]